MEDQNTLLLTEETVITTPKQPSRNASKKKASAEKKRVLAAAAKSLQFTVDSVVKSDISIKNTRTALQEYTDAEHCEFGKEDAYAAAKQRLNFSTEEDMDIFLDFPEEFAKFKATLTIKGQSAMNKAIAKLQSTAAVVVVNSPPVMYDFQAPNLTRMAEQLVKPSAAQDTAKGMLRVNDDDDIDEDDVDDDKDDDDSKDDESSITADDTVKGSKLKSKHQPILPLMALSKVQQKQLAANSVCYGAYISKMLAHEPWSISFGGMLKGMASASGLISVGILKQYWSTTIRGSDKKQKIVSVQVLGSPGNLAVNTLCGLEAEDTHHGYFPLPVTMAQLLSTIEACKESLNGPECDFTTADKELWRIQLDKYVNMLKYHVARVLTANSDQKSKNHIVTRAYTMRLAFLTLSNAFVNQAPALLCESFSTRWDIHVIKNMDKKMPMELSMKEFEAIMILSGFECPLCAKKGMCAKFCTCLDTVGEARENDKYFKSKKAAKAKFEALPANAGLSPALSHRAFLQSHPQYQGSEPKEKAGKQSAEVVWESIFKNQEYISLPYTLDIA